MILLTWILYGKVELKKNIYDENKKYKFTGNRIKRGQYKYNEDLKMKLDYINADMNGSLNILRKYLNNKDLLEEKSNSVNDSKIADIKLVEDFRRVLRTRGVLVFQTSLGALARVA